MDVRAKARHNPVMKLPRWLVIAMLTTSVLAVLAAAGWCWVTWPERTAREFVELLATDKVEEARAMMGQGQVDWEVHSGKVFLIGPLGSSSAVVRERRSIGEFLAATARYRFPEQDWTFTVRRASVMEPRQLVLWIPLSTRVKGLTEANRVLGEQRGYVVDPIDGTKITLPDGTEITLPSFSHQIK